MNSLKFQDRLLDLQDNLLNFAYMLTSNREEAKDLLQDTTLKALDNEDKYIDNVNFKGWVFTIMRNIFINNYRRVVRNQTIIDQTEDLYHLNLPQDSGFDSPEGSFTVQEITKPSTVSARSTGCRLPCMWPDTNITRLPRRWICRWAPSKAASFLPASGCRRC